MWTITRRAALAATAAAVLLLVLPGHVGWLYGVNAALVAAVVVDHLRTPAPRRLGIDRDAPATVRLGGEARLVWTVSNPTDRRLRVALADDLRPSLGAERRARLDVPARGRARAATTLRPTRRGTVRPTEVTVRVEGPWRLGARQQRVAVPGRIVVLPAFGSRRQAELRADRARRADAGLRTARGRGGGTEFDSLRDYTVDDDPRRIDWIATARSRAPVVRTYRPERNQTVLVLVDTGRTTAARVAGVPRLDFLLDAALAVTLAATRLGDRVGVVTFDEVVRSLVPPRSSRDQSGLVAGVLADASPRLVEADYVGAFAETLSRFRRRALLVLLTDLSPGAADETLLPALRLLTRDHEVVVAAVDDPAIAGWAAATPEDAEGAYRAAAATRELSRRRDLSARLAAAGAQVVAAAPGDLGVAVVDAYLDVKRSGIL